MTSLIDQNQLLKAQTDSLDLTATAAAALPEAALLDKDTASNDHLSSHAVERQQMTLAVATNGHSSSISSQALNTKEAVTSKIDENDWKEEQQVEISALKLALSESEDKLGNSVKDFQDMRGKYEALKDEQEDLLVMLSDQDTRVKKYREKYKRLLQAATDNAGQCGINWIDQFQDEIDSSSSDDDASSKSSSESSEENDHFSAAGVNAICNTVNK